MKLPLSLISDGVSQLLVLLKRAAKITNLPKKIVILFTHEQFQLKRLVVLP